MVVFYRTQPNQGIAAILVACAISLALAAPAAADSPPADGSVAVAGASVAVDGGGARQLPPVPKPGRDFVDIVIRTARGRLQLDSATRGRFAKPTAVTRYSGRFKVEVVVGKKLLDVLQFDFPMMSGTSIDATEEAREFVERLEQNMNIATRVRVPLPDGFSDASDVDPARRGVIVVYPPKGAPLVVNLATAKAEPAAPVTAPRTPR